MSEAVVAAIVAGVVSLLVTFGKVLWDARQKKQERRLAAREKLDRYREPLLIAVDDLGSRINNIRNDGFLFYLGVRGRERTALLGTLFRLLRSIGRTLATDRLDRADPSDATTTQLMIWREEQRAIGEVMRAGDDPPRCMSFDSFVSEYDSRFATWFETFASQLDPASTPRRDRLAKLQRLLASLIRKLDVDRVLVQADPDGIITEPRWAQPSMLSGTAEANMVRRGPAGGA